MKITKEFIAISLFLIVIPSCFFYYINSLIRPFNEWQALKYSTPDSVTYLNAGKWLLKEISFNEAKESVAIRPFFYPLIVATLERIHPLALFIFQFILWQLQIVIVYLFSVKLIKSRYISIIIALISASVISPIFISLHALTENLTLFLITFSVFMLACYIRKKTYRYIFLHLLALSLCSVTRPSMLYSYIFSLAMIFFFIKNKKCILFLLVLVTFTPIATQYHIMKENFNTYRLSFIDIVTINGYFLTGIELYKRNLEQDANKNYFLNKVRNARRVYLSNILAKEGYSVASEKVKIELLDNISRYPLKSIHQFTDLIIENSMQASPFSGAKELLYFLTLSQSTLLLVINIASSLLFILTTAWILRENVISTENTIFSFPVFFLLYFIYFSNGITFYQGDRFLVPIYYASIMLFVYQAVSFFAIFRNMKKNSNNISKMTSE